MLKRKKEVGKRQFYRRIEYNVQTAVNEIVFYHEEKQPHIIPNFQVEQTTSHNTHHNVDNQKLRNVETTLHADSDINVLLPLSIENNDYLFDNSDNVYEECFINFNIPPVITNSESLSESTHVLDLKTSLTQWILKFKIPHVAANNLLQILAPLNPDLPLDCRTLLKTPVKTIIKKLENGEYVHIGIKCGLKHIFSNIHFL